MSKKNKNDTNIILNGQFEFDLSALEAQINKEKTNKQEILSKMILNQLVGEISNIKKELATFNSRLNELEIKLRDIK